MEEMKATIPKAERSWKNIMTSPQPYQPTDAEVLLAELFTGLFWDMVKQEEKVIEKAVA